METQIETTLSAFEVWWEGVTSDETPAPESAEGMADQERADQVAAETFATQAPRDPLAWIPEPSIRWIRERQAFAAIVPGTRYTAEHPEYFTEFEMARLFAQRMWMKRWNRTTPPHVRRERALFCYNFRRPADRARYRAYYAHRDGGLLGKPIVIRQVPIHETLAHVKPMPADTSLLPEDSDIVRSLDDLDPRSRRGQQVTDIDPEVAFAFGATAYVMRGAYRPTSRPASPGDYADGTWIVWTPKADGTPTRLGAFLSERAARQWAYDHGFSWVDCQAHPAVTVADFADPTPLTLDPAVIAAARARLHPTSHPAAVAVAS